LKSRLLNPELKIKKSEKILDLPVKNRFLADNFEIQLEEFGDIPK